MVGLELLKPSQETDKLMIVLEGYKEGVENVE